jgi:transposase-like protein
MARYGQKFKERVVARLLPPESSPVEAVSQTVGISVTTLEEPRRVTRVFFDCRDAAPDPADRQRIEKAIGQSLASAQRDDDLEALLLAA